MKIPDVVLQEASETMEMLEGTLVYLGKIGDGRDVFLFKQPIDAETGFPFVYLYDGQSAMEITKNHERITGRFFDPLKMADVIIMNGIKNVIEIK